MSDYLWDRKGEPDADTRRLEELLGELRHRPRALELPKPSPSSSPGSESSSAGTRRAWLAFAAVLMLAALACAFVVTRQFKTGGERPTVARVSEGATAATAQGARVKEDGKDAVEDSQGPTVDGRRAGVVAPRRAGSRRESKAKVVEAASAREAERGRLAKEQLVYALRLTSSELREVQRKAQDIVDGVGGGPEGLR